MWSISVSPQHTNFMILNSSIGHERIKQEMKEEGQSKSKPQNQKST
jgi:hypothetical protein